MPKRLFPTNVVAQAQTVLAAWNQIGATVTLGTLLPASLTTDVTNVTNLETQIASLELQLTNARNQRDALYVTIWDKVKRVRAGTKANYGDDSSQYEMMGGTRLSDRKSPVRRILSSPN